MARLMDGVRRTVILNGMHSASLSGDICSFKADNTLKMTKLTANVVPTQTPVSGWVNKNLLDPSTFTDRQAISESGSIVSSTISHYSAIVPVTELETYTFSGIHANSGANYKRVHAYADGVWMEQVAVLYYTSGANHPFSITFTVPSGANGIRVSDRMDDKCLQIEVGSEATSYSPHLNPTQIGGWTGANIFNDPKYGGIIEWNQRCGTAASSGTGGGVTYTNNGDGSWTLTNNGTGTNRKQISSPSSISVGDIVFFCHGASVEGSSSTFYVCFSQSGTHLETAGLPVGRVIKCGYAFDQFSIRTFSGFRPPEGGLVLKPMWCNLTQMFGAEEAERIYNLEGYGSHGVEYFRSLFPNDYYAYNSGTKTIVSAVSNLPHTSIPYDWTDSAGTVYRGTLNVLTGQFTATHGIVTLDGTESWAKYSTNYCRLNPTSSRIKGFKGDAECIGNMFSNGGDTYTPTNGKFGWKNTGTQVDGVLYLTFRLDGFTDQSGTTAWTNLLTEWSNNNIPLTVVLRYITPIEVTFTPQEVRTILGQNNIWADCGTTELKHWQHN